MSTKIDLDYPYSLEYKAGYLNTNSDNRKTLMLVRNDGSKTSTAYARYLLACKHKRYLTANEQADHINEDKTDDRIDNLQILSRKNNVRKHISIKNKTKKIIKLNCPICENEFERFLHRVKDKMLKGKKPCCSRKCGGKMSHL